MLNKLKKNNKKGFTLVELIVVLVILAILAALLIPALTGYIDKAKQKDIIAETRQVVMAAQTIVDEEYGKGVEVSSIGTPSTFTAAAVAALAEVTATNIDSITVTDGLVTEAKYTKGGKTCTYTKTNATSQATFDVAD